ncbi:hypothetical protein FQA39_LY19271 [Lamprigera yunnana]|nr:hypothetical protein FQA39_LY19271 [Lamprigera yunnana]
MLSAAKDRLSAQAVWPMAPLMIALQQLSAAKDEVVQQLHQPPPSTTRHGHPAVFEGAPMKRYIGSILIAVNVVLAVALAWLWLKPNGELKNTHWQAPRAQKSNLDGVVPHLGKPQAMNQSQFLAMLDRPLFSITRRPPPPPPPPAAEVPPPPPDYLSEAVLTGMYFSRDGKSGGNQLYSRKGQIAALARRSSMADAQLRSGQPCLLHARAAKPRRSLCKGQCSGL